MVHVGVVCALVRQPLHDRMKRKRASRCGVLEGMLDGMLPHLHPLPSNVASASNVLSFARQML